MYTAPRRRLSLGVLAMISAASAVVACDDGPPFVPGQPYDHNFPDPAIIEVDDVYYAYATATGGASIPVMTSTDLVTWTTVGDALTVGPSWCPSIAGVGGCWTWAPSVVELPDGSFMAAFAAPTAAGDRRCIATAHATSPVGPFEAVGDHPFVCEDDPAGAIDPFLVVDEHDVAWLVWKNEGVPDDHPTSEPRRTAFWSRPLTDDGRAWRPGSAKHFLLEASPEQRPWQGQVIENPALIRFEGTWLLLYSANDWDSPDYVIGYAVCQGPGGPCVEPGYTPLLASTSERLGPGGPAPLVGPESWLRLGYHAWDPPHASYAGSQRRLHIDHLCLAGTRVFIWEDDGRVFCDVGPGRFYSQPVEWLAETGLTTGVTPSLYGFDRYLTRAESATFLWRLVGEPTPLGAPPFIDTEPEAYYGDAVAWLAETGVTTGVEPNRFDPDGVVTRAQMAAFLCRFTRTDSYVVTGAATEHCPSG